MAKETFGMSGKSPIKVDMKRGTYRDMSPAGPPPADTEAAFAQAAHFFRKGRLKDAETRVRYVLDREPGHIDATYLLGQITLQTGRAKEAVRLISKAIEGKGGVAEFHVNLGVALLASGQAEAGERSFESAIKIQTENGDAHLRLGIVLLRRGEFNEAISHLRAAARLMPEQPDARMNLGLALSHRDGSLAGIGDLRKAVELGPKDGLARASLGNALIDLGDFDSALVEFDVALALHPNAATLHFRRGRLLNQLGREREAVVAYSQAVALDGSLAPAQNELALILNRRGRHREAEVCARKAVSLAPKQFDFRLNYGNILAAAGRTSEALTCYESLEQEFPEFAEAYLQHAKVLQDSGDFARASDVLDTLRHINPDLTLVFQRLAADPSVAFTPEELGKVASFIEDDKADEATVGELCFDMGQVLERNERYDQSFAYYIRANKIRNAACNYNPDVMCENTNRLISTFDAGVFEDRREDGMADDRPVFIVGMPCSGTSQIERIIARHRWVGGAGEMKDFGILARELPHVLGGGGLEYPACVRLLVGKKVHQLAGIYLNRMSRMFPGFRRFIDAMPGNFRHAGLIALLFPRARIIHCRRNALDTCLSIFAQNFSSQDGLADEVSFAFDLENIAHFYGQYVRLMDHWRHVCPTPIFDVDFVDLVAEPEGKTREMLDFCGLDWDDDCLDVDETGPIGPTYAPSRWKSYGGQLVALKAALEGYGVPTET